MAQHSRLGQDHASKKTLNVGFVLNLFPSDFFDDFTHQVEGESFKLAAVVGVGHQVLDLWKAAADGAPDNVALVVFEGLKKTISLHFSKKLKSIEIEKTKES